MGMYEIQIELQNLPFLEGSLHSLGLLNYCPATEIMSKKVVTLRDVDKVSRIVSYLRETRHNGFPVVNRSGHLCGMILRKTLCSLLKLKAFSTPSQLNAVEAEGVPKGASQLVAAATVFYDTLERSYPLYPEIDDVKISKQEMVRRGSES